ncbi:uncharacterized protein LOC129270107 [Lytechinus pictus]|uniref:uncharacterized protein LOC129270107 n=1 Tax=Lytechinus pictus TaxID=7653 RepID=UPI0030BA28D7
MASFDKILFLILTIFGITSHGMHTVPELNPESYVGRWYQVYTNAVSDFFTGVQEPDCGTADYTLINSTYVTVYNANYRLDEEFTDGLGGYAYVPDPSIPGELKVVLDGVPVAGDYWVFKLGPLIEGKYQYSLVTDGQDARQLYVLSRDPEEFYELYDHEVSEYVALNGFTGPVKTPYEVPHPPECRYPPSPPE